MIKILRIIKKIFAFPRLWKGTRIIEQSINLLAQGNVAEAERIFEEGEVYWGTLPIQYKITKGDIKFRLQKREECLEIFKSAWADVDNNEQLSEPDKLYLKAHMYSAMKIYNSYLKMDMANIEPVEPSDVPLDMVSKIWTRRFPSRDHPDWDKFGSSG